jgi:purine catabolism regulator
VHDYLTVADLLAMPHLGLELRAGSGGAGASVLWTHTSELEDPGPWMEGGELLIVNGFGIPADAEGQVTYVARLAQHRLAGLAVSVKAPELTDELLQEADRLDFPVLRVPRQIPFIEISHLVANASVQTTRGRLSRHLRVFETLRYRTSVESNVVEIYSELEDVSGYRLALISPAGRPLLPDWPWVPDGLELEQADLAGGLQVIPGGYILPLVVGNRVTAYLVGMEHLDAKPGGLATLQHVGTLAALDAVDDQRRREALHRQGSALLSSALDGDLAPGELVDRFSAAGLDPAAGLRLLACGIPDDDGGEIAIRDWLSDRGHPHLLRDQGVLFVAVPAVEVDLAAIVIDLGIHVGASQPFHRIEELPRMQRQSLWSLNLARESSVGAVVLAEEQFGIGRWLNPDVEMMKHLADGVLNPIIAHDADHGTDLVRTLAVYFQHQGRLRQAAAQLFVHEHTLSYRIKKIEQLTGRNLKNYRDAFELWLAVESRFLINEQ